LVLIKNDLLPAIIWILRRIIKYIEATRLAEGNNSENNQLIARRLLCPLLIQSSEKKATKLNDGGSTMAGDITLYIFRCFVGASRISDFGGVFNHAAVF
jgi:hypothetical protein